MNRDLLLRMRTAIATEPDHLDMNHWLGQVEHDPDGYPDDTTVGNHDRYGQMNDAGNALEMWKPEEWTCETTGCAAGHALVCATQEERNAALEKILAKLLDADDDDDERAYNINRLSWPKVGAALIGLQQSEAEQFFYPDSAFWKYRLGAEVSQYNDAITADVMVSVIDDLLAIPEDDPHAVNRFFFPKPYNPLEG